MVESEEFCFSLDNLFFDRPVVQEVRPLCQEQNAWQLDAAPSISEIPATQDLQKEAESLALTGYSQKPRTFLPPFKRPNGNAGQAGATENQQMFHLWGPEITSDTFHTPAGSDQTFPAAPQHAGENGPFCLTPSPSLKTRLFRPPMRKVDPVSVPATNDHGISPVVMATEHPLMPPAVASCGPLGEVRGQREECSDREQNDAFVLPFSPRPLQIRGPSGQGILRPVSEIPAKFRDVFSEFPYFNYVQSKALDDVLYTSRNFVACAPTGSGKTVLFELAIIRLLMETAEPWNDVKAIYMAPIKALCSQCYENWKQKFGPLGLNCKELTGDTEIDEFFEIQDAHLIMTTPEKWDSMTRRWRDNFLLQSVRLFLIDEVHVVKDVTRGATLEVVVSRMKTIQTYRTAEDPDSETCMRFVAVSATIPNIHDISEWLSDGSGPAVCLKMDESHRPVKLRKVVLGFPCGNKQNEFKFDLSLNYKMAGIVQTYSEQKPTLVFCSTRKGVQQAAAVLAKDARFIMSIDHRQRLMKYANSLLDTKLRDLVMCGVGYHHAGVSMSDRKVVEDAFTAGDLPVLFTTSTLAMGVNLPAHLVVIKSTLHYVGGACQEYSEADLLQMIGRAGRPQFDSSATAVIMTRSQTRDKYLQFLSGSETIESSLHTNLVEHLNAEIVLHTISDVNMALDWIRSTFLYIRALKNPRHYGFSADLDKCGIETKLQELCIRNLNSLASFNLITMDEDINIKPTESGKLMARYCVAFDTMKQFSKVTGTETLSELIELISKGKEFSDVQLRVSEKRTLNMLNKDRNRVTIRYSMDGKIKTNDMKVNCLIQAQLGCIPVQEFGLMQDTGKIFRNGIRLSRCLVELLSQNFRRNFSALLNAVVLAKCFRARLWEDSPYVSKQLDRIGLSLANAMVNAGLTTFSKIEATNPRELELIVNRHPPFGNQIREAVSRLPRYEVGLEQLPRYSVFSAELIVTVHLKNFEELLVKRTAPDHHHVTLLIGDGDNNVVFQQKISDTLLLKSGSWSRKFEVSRTPIGDELGISLISSEYVGLDIQQRFTTFYSGAQTFRADVYGVESPVCVPRRAQEYREGTSVGQEKRGQKDQGQQNRVQKKQTDGNFTQTDPSKRHCNHLCKNKDLCGHDCCKSGGKLPMVLRRVVNPESTFSSYLQDLKMRNERLMETPVKRLKMRINSEAETISMQNFSYKPKHMMPALARLDEQYFLQNASQSVEAEQSYATPQQQPDPQTYHDDASTRNPANQSEAYSTTSHFSSDTLNVTFDLTVDDWDDFEDENLLLAGDDSCGRNRSDDCAQATDNVAAAPGSVRPNSPSGTGCETSSLKASPPKQINTGDVSLGGRFDFFSKRDSQRGEEHTGFTRSGTEEREEVDMFLGIFDGIF